MVGFSNVLLLLASLAGLTTGLLKPQGEKRNSGIGDVLGTLGKSLLGGLLGGGARSQDGGGGGGGMDAGLASVLSKFGEEFGDKKTTGSAGTGAGFGSAPASNVAGPSAPPREQDSSEEKTKFSVTKPQDTGTGEFTTKKPEKPDNTAGISQGPKEEPPKPAAGASGAPGSVGGDLARNVGAAAGAALASTLFAAIADALRKSRERKRGGQRDKERSNDRREKRSLVDELVLMESKGSHKGLNLEPDLSNGVYCGRHEMPNPGGVRDRFCHPKATWTTLLRMRPDCVCQSGFLRNSWGECISPTECNQCRSKHHLNMDYHLCGSPCPIVCNQPIDEYCPNTCIRKCACRPGFIRKYPNGPCVSIKKCLPGCRGRNQIFSLCSSLCPPTCRRLRPKRCPKVCAGEGCVCKPGFVVKKWEPLVCVRPDRCPGRRRKCTGPNQVYTRCKRRCAPSCFTRRHRYCGKDCLGRGCVCKRGFVVLQWRPLVCVRRNKCPARRKQCPARNQIYKFCKSKCPPTCAQPKPRKCGSACGGEGCACKPGFVVKQENPLVCVRRSRCNPARKGAKRPQGGRGSFVDDPFAW